MAVPCTPNEAGRALTDRPAGFKPALAYADWGRAHGPISRAAFFAVQLLDGFETTRDAVAGRLPTVLAQAGFAQVTETRHFIAAFGILYVYRATKDAS